MQSNHTQDLQGGFGWIKVYDSCAFTSLPGWVLGNFNSLLNFETPSVRVW